MGQSEPRPSIDKLTGETVRESNERRYPERFGVGQSEPIDCYRKALERIVYLAHLGYRREDLAEIAQAALEDRTPEVEPPSRGRSE